jgi:RNA polymerase sigma-70 factor (ECF subfamily)
VGNEARNRRRARGRREGLAERAIAAVRGASGGVPSTPAPELEALAAETQAEVRTALATLDDGERLVVTCRYLLGLSEAETAAALGIPAGTVKSRLHRGLRRMRDRLEPAVRSMGASS